MTGNELQHFRRTFIESCLRNSMRAYTKDEIKELLSERYLERFGNTKGCGSRNFESDWAFIKKTLEENELTLTKWKNDKGWCYRYSDLDFTISDISLTKKELNKLADAVKFLQQIKGIDLNNELTEILQKLDAQVKYHTSSKNDIISLQYAEPASGYGWIDSLYEAIIELNVLKIRYHPFNKEKIETIIHPYHLRQYNNRWFLFGWDESRNAISNLALDRIEKVTVAGNKTYKLPIEVFNAKEHFKNIIGVTNFTHLTVEDIILLFSKERAPYIISKKIHDTQEILEKKEDGSILIKLQVKQNFELKSFLLSQGSHVTVLAPQSLAQEIANELKQTLARYSGSTS